VKNNLFVPAEIFDANWKPHLRDRSQHGSMSTTPIESQVNRVQTSTELLENSFEDLNKSSPKDFPFQLRDFISCQNLRHPQQSHKSTEKSRFTHDSLNIAWTITLPSARLLLFTVPPSLSSSRESKQRENEIGIFAVTRACNSISFFLPHRNAKEAERKSRKRGT
jgi:hypothetical protein